MLYHEIASNMAKLNGVEISTMMKSPCLRYDGNFIAMMFEKQDALIVKLSEQRVNEILESGEGLEFNFTKKRFKQWVLIPLEFEQQYETYMNEALNHAKAI